MSVDFSDVLDSNGDLLLTSSKQYKAYNLFKCNFLGFKEIGFDFVYYLHNQINVAILINIINDYLNSYNALADKTEVNFDNVSGKLEIKLHYNGDIISI